MLLIHPDSKTLHQATFLAESSSNSGHSAGVVEGTGELLFGQSIASKEGFTAFTGNCVEVQPVGLVPADNADFRSTGGCALFIRKRTDCGRGSHCDAMLRTILENKDVMESLSSGDL